MSFNKLGHLLDAEHTKRHYLYHEYIHDIDYMYREFTDNKIKHLTNLYEFRDISKYLCNHNMTVDKKKSVGFGNRKITVKYCLICDNYI